VVLPVGVIARLFTIPLHTAGPVGVSLLMAICILSQAGC
jgi:hypothetical protein